MLSAASWRLVAEPRLSRRVQLAELVEHDAEVRRAAARSDLGVKRFTRAVETDCVTLPGSQVRQRPRERLHLVEFRNTVYCKRTVIRWYRR